MRRAGGAQRGANMLRAVLTAAALLGCAAQKTTSAAVLGGTVTNVVLDWNAQANGASRPRAWWPVLRRHFSNALQPTTTPAQQQRMPCLPRLCCHRAAPSTQRGADYRDAAQ